MRHFTWRPKYILLLLLTLSCHTSALSEWNVIRLYNLLRRDKHYMNTTHSTVVYTHRIRCSSQADIYTAQYMFVAHTDDLLFLQWHKVGSTSLHFQSMHLRHPCLSLYCLAIVTHNTRDIKYKKLSHKQNDYSLCHSQNHIQATNCSTDRQTDSSVHCHWAQQQELE
jgi:hypothetical protein